MRNRTVASSIGLGIWLVVGALVASIATLPVPAAQSREADRTLKLYFGHTGERGEFTFKRNGRYDRRELDKINDLLRDWRRNEPTKMDPLLLDLIWAIYKQTGSREYINVVSAYRAPATNSALRKRSKGVAENSQHTHGKAMDFYIPGVPLAKLRAIALKFQGGGVGYYPTSGSPFIHVDTGSVRYWPRMSRQQLLAVFPNGETLYVPSDGKPLQGYERALAKRKSGGGTALAYLEPGNADRDSDGNWLTRVFAGDPDEEEDAAETAATPPLPQRPAAPAETATGAPEMLLAGDLVDPRLPRRRPGEVEVEIAALDVGISDGASLAARAPLPRERPDASLLASSLETGGLPSTLQVQAQDAIAMLAVGNATMPSARDPAEPERATAASDADRAILTGFAAIEDAMGELAPSIPADAGEAATALPRRRPVALAFAGSGLPPADLSSPPGERTPAAPQPAATSAGPVEPAAAPGMTSASVEIAALPLPDAAYGADAAALQGLIVMVREPEPVVDLTMPEPAGASTLFAAAPDAGSATPLQSAAPLPADHFLPATSPQRSERGFFSKLFASLVE